MIKKRGIYIPAIAVCTGLIIYLVIPLSSRDHTITYRQDLIEKKYDFLNRNKARNSGQARRPNVIILLADDLGKTDISLYGGRGVSTPRIDSIGRNGVAFTEAYCTSPICSPSRAGLLTGRFQQRFGFEYQPHNRYPWNRIHFYTAKYIMNTGDLILTRPKSYPRKKDIARQGIPPSETTLGELLKSVGYHTAVMGKWHLGFSREFLPLQRGFDYHYGFYEAFSLYAPADDPGIVNYRHADFADRYIWSRGRKKTCAIRRNDTVVDEKGYLTFRIAEESVRFIEEQGDKPFFLYVPFSAPHTPFQAPRSYWERFSHVKDQNKRIYYAMIAALDDAVGSILEAVSRLGLSEDTIIIFASDNGGATYTGATENAPLRGGKFTDFEGGLNIPFMIQWVGKLPTGTRYDAPVSLLDVFTTVAAAAGSDLPDYCEIDGVDLIPLILGKDKPDGGRTIVWRRGFNKAIRRGQWKLIADVKHDQVRLFNLAQDKNETRNIAADNPDIVEGLLKDFERYENDFSHPLWPYMMEFRYREGEEESFFAI